MSAPSARLLLAVVIAAIHALAATTAHAQHPALDRAIAHVEDADFASALASFEEAEAASDLSREDLLRLFANRSTVHFALGEAAAMEADLARLLALEPTATLPSSAPPPVHEVLERLRGSISPPAIDAAIRGSDSGAEVRAQVRERGADLVRGVRAWARRIPEGDWERGEGGALSIEGPAGAAIDWYAEALGPGGVIVASEGARGDPHRFVIPDRAVLAASSDDLTWWLVGGGSAAVVLGAVATGIAIVLGSTTTTTIGGPVLIP